MTQEETYNLSIPMKDKSVQKLSVTRSDVEKWLNEHEKSKLIDSDDDKLLANFVHAYSMDYNKSHPRPKGTRGGVREGAGRKGKAGGSFHHGFRFSKKVHDILELYKGDDMTSFVENAIVAYHRYINREDL